MTSIQKGLVISGLSAIGALGIVLMVSAARRGDHTGMCEKAGKGIDERLEGAISALDKASAHVQSAFEHIKNAKA